MLNPPSARLWLARLGATTKGTSALLKSFGWQNWGLQPKAMQTPSDHSKYVKLRGRVEKFTHLSHNGEPFGSTRGLPAPTWTVRDWFVCFNHLGTAVSGSCPMGA
eukprot:1717244-Amphidinium_carterae.2